MDLAIRRVRNHLISVALVCFCSVVSAIEETDHQQGLLLLGRGEYEAAEALYRAATQLDGADTVARSHLAISLIRQQRYDEAESQLNIVFSQDPVYVADRIAVEYALISPRRAASWSLELGNVPDRPPIVSSTVIAWANKDFDAARDWVSALPKGEIQDAGLGGLVRAISETSIPDTALLDAFSSDLNRQWWLRSSIVPLTRHNPGIARRLIEQYIDDDNIRQEAEQFYEIGLRIRASEASE